MHTMHCKIVAPSRPCVLRAIQSTSILIPLPKCSSRQICSSAQSKIRTTTKASSDEASSTSEAALAAGVLPQEVIIAAAEIAPVTQEPVHSEPPTLSGSSTGQDVKAALLDALYDTERGFSARAEVRAEINELVSQLESMAPAFDSTEQALQQLDGTWTLYFSSDPAMLAILALGKLPFITIGDMTQRIDSQMQTLENKVCFMGPLARTSVSTRSSFDMRSTRRMQLQVESGVFETPEIDSNSIVFPSSISILGQTLDTSPLQSAFQPVTEQIKGLMNQVSGVAQQTPDLQIPMAVGESGGSWLINTYVSDGLRITRGDGGSVFIFTKF